MFEVLCVLHIQHKYTASDIGEDDLRAMQEAAHNSIGCMWLIKQVAALARFYVPPAFNSSDVLCKWDDLARMKSSAAQRKQQGTT